MLIHLKIQSSGTTGFFGGFRKTKAQVEYHGFSMTQVLISRKIVNCLLITIVSFLIIYVKGLRPGLL